MTGNSCMSTRALERKLRIIAGFAMALGIVSIVGYALGASPLVCGDICLFAGGVTFTTWLLRL